MPNTIATAITGHDNDTRVLSVRDRTSIIAAAQANSQTTRAEGLHLLRSASFETQASNPKEIAPATHIDRPVLIIKLQ
jgi:hypothetical protein